MTDAFGKANSASGKGDARPLDIEPTTEIAAKLSDSIGPGEAMAERGVRQFVTTIETSSARNAAVGMLMPPRGWVNLHRLVAFQTRVPRTQRFFSVMGFLVGANHE